MFKVYGYFLYIISGIRRRILLLFVYLFIAFNSFTQEVEEKEKSIFPIEKKSNLNATIQYGIGRNFEKYYLKDPYSSISDPLVIDQRRIVDWFLIFNAGLLENNFIFEGEMKFVRIYKVHAHSAYNQLYSKTYIGIHSSIGGNIGYRFNKFKFKIGFALGEVSNNQGGYSSYYASIPITLEHTIPLNRIIEIPVYIRYETPFDQIHLLMVGTGVRFMKGE